MSPPAPVASTPGRSPGRSLVVEADGGSRGNPGVAGYGALVRDADTGDLLVELAEPLGRASNNVAEYSGLLAGLRAAIEIDSSARVRVRMDSKLVVEQMAGRWKIKHEDMRRLALEARDLCARLTAQGGSVDFEWIPRESNAGADALSNEAMDGHSVRRVHTGSSSLRADDETTRGLGAGSREALRLLLVQLPDDPDAAPRIARAVAALAGEDARFYASADPSGGAAAAAIEERLGQSAHVLDDWTAAGQGGSDGQVRAAYRSLVESGGTVVALTSRRGVLTVVSDVLGLAPERFWAVATAPGSLTGVEVWPDGSASVAFTNRTDHLA